MQDNAPRSLEESLDDSLEGLKKVAWIRKIAEIADEHGHFQSCGHRHFGAFIEKGGTLLVTFEAMGGAQANPDGARPLGWEFVLDQGWSHLGLFADGDTFCVGGIDARVMLSPGHTLGSITFVVGDAIFAHDTFMQPDSGTARADFPGGSAAMLYDSLMAILALPDEYRIFIGHDYRANGRDAPAWESTVAEQKASNKHLGGGVAKDEYVKVREARDATLDLPNRMLHALQLNLRGGRLPEPEGDGNSYFKIPANRF
jgi:glyoxylase-like metal-dependent hydrolase (beta-lactamase superfamily II)